MRTNIEVGSREEEASTHSAASTLLAVGCRLLGGGHDVGTSHESRAANAELSRFFFQILSMIPRAQLSNSFLFLVGYSP